MDQPKNRVAPVAPKVVSRSVITLRSRWNDKEWVPEIGSKERPMPAMPPQGRAYVLDNVIHYITADEIQAGERVGCESYIAYACSTLPANPPARKL